MHMMRVVTVYEPDIKSLPGEFRSVLTEQDCQTIQNSKAFFSKLAEHTELKWLRRLLRKCAASGWELQFYASNDDPYRPYFRFLWEGEPALSLPRPKPLRADLPPFLRQIYSVIGSYRENPFGYSGGLHPGDRLGPVSEMGIPVEPGGDIDPAAAIPFLETYSGSQLCYLPDGGGAWLEACQFRKVQNLERDVTKYFEGELRGERALFDRD
jgi:hypothetical protein